MPPCQSTSPTNPSFRALILGAIVLAISLAGALSSQARGAPSAEEKLDRVESKLEKEQGREQVLTSEIEAYDAKISAIQSEVSGLRQQESVAESELSKKQTELDEAIRALKLLVDRLEAQRNRLKRALISLRQNLVANYMSGSPDLNSVIFASEDFGDLVASDSYFEVIQNQTESLVSRVRDLRDEARANVEVQRDVRSRIESARNQIASREQLLEATRMSLELRQSSLSTLRSDKENLLGAVRDDIEQHEEIAADLRSKVQATIAEASSSSVSTTSSADTGSMIWPIDGILTSPFGPRWGRVHEGLDISAPGGTPIKAASSGTVILMQSEAESGGYGLFTCVDHGGGLSTCYAHQSSFGTSVGAEVSQGDVIGYVGNTGNSFGDHLHFETRVDGVAQDPLGYL